MGTNSILSSLQYEDMISTIKLKMGADINKEKVFVIVEGRDDINLLKTFFKTNVSICESYSGKKGVLEILKFFKEKNNVIGIRDRDYEKRKGDTRIFYYDYCNLEMMMLNDKEVFGKLMAEYCDDTRKSEEVKNKILVNLSFLSELRKINEYKKKMWNFNGLDYRKILEENNDVKKESVLNELKKINPKVKKKEFLEGLQKKDKYTYKEMLNMTNGHDFLKFFGEYCKKKTGKNVAYNALGINLRTGFVTKKFKNTKLHKLLKQYQDKNCLQIV